MTDGRTSSLPEIPKPNVDPNISLDFIAENTDIPEVKHRIDSVQRLAAENDKLTAELKAMDERLRAIERRTQELENQKRGANTGTRA
ncbi:hypothetical protein PUNSTDRAFT_121514 [Punctularia strigosozonata HHB-11173 SS5]|uniref:uncharacterized protein n=1 Tax=Punctularia strigosozonata (strain HHB-11173) TaxID=741275 RepID=UPI00044180A5|nr:uncharacterized protein PUNSTDRAFT_121514 [Punctularia strigosozonata HHB-11173 SS5]EIN07390.1 hypothetical protein PUNSTDRAFT_121514 [Punctularia strigosozonata HHB-11173 SS5]